MTLEKAIEELTDLDKGCDPVECADSKKALKIAIKAVELLLYGREHRYLFPRERLQGETKEGK